jgi:serine/threonine protein kinase
LSALHARQPQIIIRDLKPANLMRRSDGRLILIDFGIARTAMSGGGGTAIGTPGYAPPEQYQGMATVQSDVYAFAATLHHLLTGRDPTHATPFSFPPARHLVASVPEQVSSAIARGLSMRAEDRFPSISAFLAAMGTIVPQAGLPSATTTPALRHASAMQVVALPALVSQGLLGRVGRGQLLRAFPLATGEVVLISTGGVVLIELVDDALTVRHVVAGEEHVMSRRPDFHYALTNSVQRVVELYMLMQQMTKRHRLHPEGCIPLPMRIQCTGAQTPVQG